MASPDKAFFIKNIDADTEEDAQKLGDSHALFLVERSTGLEENIYTYGRFAQVSWAPKADFVAITDFDGSDHAGCKIFCVPDKKIIDVEEAVRKNYPGSPQELTASHLYFRAMSWISDTQLEIMVDGYGLLVGKDHLVETHCVYNAANGNVSLK